MRFHKTLIILSFIAGILMCSSCATKQQQLLFKQSAPIPDSARNQNSGNGTSDYHIRSQDLLQIRNLQNIKYIVEETPTNTTAVIRRIYDFATGQTYQVEDDGSVALPVIGHVQVAGLTRAEAAKQIEDLYRKNVLKDPIIDLKIINLKVTLLGEVKAQGNFPLVKDRTNLIEMIGEAGGLTERANEKNIKIITGRP